MLWLLLTHERTGCTKDFLREHVDDYRDIASESAFERKFSRDKQLLRDVGLPLQSATTVAGQTVYTIDQTQLFLPQIDFTTAEEQALAHVSGLWGHESDQDSVSRALSRLQQYPGLLLAGGATLETDDGDDSEGTEQRTVGVHLRAQLARTDKLVSEIAEACRTGRWLGFDYRKVGADTLEPRRVRAWSLVAVAAHWYLTGWDANRREQRVFRLDRLDPASVRTLDRAPSTSEGRDASPPEDFDPEALRDELLGASAVQHTQLLLRVERADSLRILGRVAPGHASGWETLNTSFTRRRSFLSALASAGTDVIVPDDALRAELVQTLERVRNLHQSPAPQPQLTSPPKTRNRASDAAVITRMIDIITVLNRHPQGLRRHELIERLGTTEALLDHDLQILQFCGLPERYAPGEQFDVIDEGGIVTLRQADELAAPLRLSTPEALAIVAGLRFVADYPGMAPETVRGARSARAKILDLLPSTEVEVVHASAEVDPSHAAKLELILDAIRRRRCLDVVYFTLSREELSERRLEPLRVVQIAERTYVQAWCQKAEALRSFRLDRLGDVELSDTVFPDRAEAADLPPIRLAPDTEGGMEATLWFSYRLRDHLDDFAPTALAELDDGSVAGLVRLQHVPIALALVTEHPGEARVLAPDSLVRQTLDHVESALRHHRDHPAQS
ncbi:MAG: helix-turn-helix transcriptional regulator [Micrococcaceae bacterium]